jgi:hypothetical protein
MATLIWINESILACRDINERLGSEFCSRPSRRQRRSPTSLRRCAIGLTPGRRMTRQKIAIETITNEFQSIHRSRYPTPVGALHWTSSTQQRIARATLARATLARAMPVAGRRILSPNFQDSGKRTLCVLREPLQSSLQQMLLSSADGAYVQHRGSVTVCQLGRKYCRSEEEWREMIKPFMEG